MKRFVIGAGLLALTTVPSLAEVTVDWLHIETVPETVAIMEAAAKEYEAANPDVKVNVQFLENEAFKAKLTTLLQSDAAPDIFYSWGGGVMSDQVEAGVLRPIGNVVSDGARQALGDAGINAFTRDGELYGLAQNVSQVVFWGNRELLDKAGVGPDDMKTWDGFLVSVQKIKDAGITPISIGAQDKWPAHFYWSYLVVRHAGQDAFNAARSGEGDGFAAEPFVKAGEDFLELIALEPFQEGYLAANYGTASGHFGDGKAALHLMGNWDYTVQRSNSASGDGLSQDQLLIVPFPTVDGGSGDDGDTLGGINGWIFHRDAPDEAVKFMEWYSSKDVQSRFAAGNSYIPITQGAADELANPFFKDISNNINQAKWHAIFFDQELGADVGGVVNDVSVELTDNAISAQEAAELVKEAVDDAQ
ncbi:MAG: extracellular solute-binding protein [Alphaproteobacteria bacterium]|nr:extracellular solute-binding protein [Alphaproteobacteria bacterium]